MMPLGPFAADRRVAVAVSGGADSLALAWLLARWGRPHALIVDHGLRDESGAEAAQAAITLATFGVPSDVLRLDGLLRGGATARAARYAALEARCTAMGLVDLCVAHHARDQAETVLMRRARGSGIAGLVGMASVAVRGHVRVLRPLLPVPPDALRTILRRADVPWCEDPGNHDPATVRGKLRRDFAADPALEVQAAMLQRDAVLVCQAYGVAAEQARQVTWEPGQAYVTGSLSVAGLSALVWSIGRTPYPPDPSAVRRAIPWRAQTLGGVQILPGGWRGPGWLLRPERTKTKGM